MTQKAPAIRIKNNALKDTKGDKIFFAINAFILGLLALIILYPLYFIVIASFSDPDAVLGGQVVLAPVNITFEGYEKVFQRGDIWQGYLNTIIYTVVTVILSLAVTIPAGWGLSRKTTPGKKFWMIYFIIPMFFGGGLIPFYNVMSSLKLINSPWAVILPAILSVWNLFMSKTFFESSIPEGRSSNHPYRKACLKRPGSTAPGNSGLSSPSCCRFPRPSSPLWRCTTLSDSGTATSTL